MKTVFWVSLFIIFYVYFGYPALLYLWSRVRGRQLRADDGYLPRVSFIIAAYNEEKGIASKLENTLGLDYPRDRLEIIVASDCCDDGTDDIVKDRYAGDVKLNCQLERRGKTSAQNDTAGKATGDILVFSDATTVYEKDSLRKLVRNFADDTVGCVGGELTYVNPSGGTVGEGGGLYWRYERWLRDMESRVCSLIGVSGCMYAVRKSLYREIDPGLISDFVIASVIYKQGSRTIHERDARCYEETTETTSDEFRMRTRVALRSLRGLWAYRALLNPFRYGFFALQLWSHKLLRYLVPVFWLLMFLGNCFLLNEAMYLVLFAGQTAVVLSALAGYYLQEKRGRKTILFVPYYFALVNLAALKGLIDLVSGKKEITWNPLR